MIYTKSLNSHVPSRHYALPELTLIRGKGKGQSSGDFRDKYIIISVLPKHFPHQIITCLNLDYDIHILGRE